MPIKLSDHVPITGDLGELAEQFEEACKAAEALQLPPLGELT